MMQSAPTASTDDGVYRNGKAPEIGDRVRHVSHGMMTVIELTDSPGWVVCRWRKARNRRTEVFPTRSLRLFRRKVDTTFEQQVREAEERLRKQAQPDAFDFDGDPEDWGGWADV